MPSKLCMPNVNQKIFKYIGYNLTILSIGCGSAKLEELAEQKNNIIYGIDISKEAIKIAKERVTKAIVADIEIIKNLPFKKAFFDLIILADVLEHLKNPAGCFQKISPYLREDGRVLISLPNVANWSIRLKLLFGNFDYKQSGILDKNHLKFFTLKTAKKLVKENGFEIIKVDYSTSLVNICYDRYLKLARYKDLKSSLQVDIVKSSFLRYLIKSLLVSFDKGLTCLFPNLFAYQFIILAKKN